VYFSILAHTVKHGKSLTRWWTMVNSMIEKEPGNPKIHRLRVIHLDTLTWGQLQPAVGYLLGMQAGALGRGLKVLHAKGVKHWYSHRWGVYWWWEGPWQGVTLSQTQRTSMSIGTPASLIILVHLRLTDS
jgi:hypothetical protein